MCNLLIRRSESGQRRIGSVGSEAVGHPVGGPYPTSAPAVQLRWGVDEVVCAATCWSNYIPTLDAKLAARRRRLRDYLEPPLEALCSRHGVASRDLWVLLRKPNGQAHETMYFRVLGIDDSGVQLGTPRGYTSAFHIEPEILEQCLRTGRFTVSRRVPAVEESLASICTRLGVAVETVQVSHNGLIYWPRFALEGTVHLATDARSGGKRMQLSLDEFSRRVTTGNAVALPAIRCSGHRGTVRYPVADDPDLAPLLTRLEGKYLVNERITHRDLQEGWAVDSTIVQAWHHLARTGHELGAPKYGTALRKNLSLFLSAGDPRMRHLAGVLLYLMTVDRQSPLSRPVLGSVWRGCQEPLLDDIEYGWLAGDRLLRRYWKAAEPLRFRRVFV